MKPIFHLLVLGAIAVFAFVLPAEAQIPRTLSYQGVLTDTLGNPRPDGIVTFTFRLYDTPTGGTAIWTEVKDLQVRRGLFFTSLGDITPFGAGVGFDRPYWLAIQPGSEPELSPRIPLTSVGYSFSAIKSDTAQYALTAPQQTYVDSARIAGTVPNLSITTAKLADNAVTSAKILDGTIQRADVASTFKAPYADTADAARTSAPSGNAGGDLTGTYPNPSIATNAVTSAKILDGTIQRADVASTFKAPYADTADAARTSAPSGNAGGDLTGTYPNPSIATNAVTSAKILDGTIQRVDVASTFKAPYADTADAARTSAPSGNAGGDLTGTYPNPSIAANAVTSAKILDGTIQRVDVASTFKAPYADTADAARTSAPSGNAGGDLTGTYPNPSIAANAVTSAKILDGTIQRVDVASTFKAPAADTADYARASVPGGTAGGDLSGTYPNPTIAAGAVTSAKILDGTITGADISSTAALNIASLTTTGNVGIGTAAPSAKLTVNNNITGVTPGVPGIVLGNPAGPTAIWQGKDASNNIEMSWIDPSYGRVIVAANKPLVLQQFGGNVGIGTTTPNEQLEITGNLRLPVSTASVGVIKSGGNRFIHNFGNDNFFAGVNAGNLTMTGSGGNTGVGVNALFSNTTGYDNTANGMSALYSNTTGSGNTANGSYALYSNTTGYENTANGDYALYSNTTGGNNTANGYQALYTNIAGSNATAIGYHAMRYANNTATGFTNSNVALGFEALRGSTTPSANTGNSNTALGYQTLLNNTTGYSNTANGFQALYSNTTGYSNTANGFQALYSNTTGYSNTANGYQALRSNTTGAGNTANGYDALRSNTTGAGNTANGYAALFSNTTGYSNTANGVDALSSNTTGYSNTANGYWALLNNTEGAGNTANGHGALRFNTTGAGNTANGVDALSSNTIGFNNTALGLSAGSSVTTGSNLTLIGYDAEPTSASATNQITLGNAAVTSLRCAVTTITALSDARDKKNIQELSLGLDFISKLKPRQFNWDKREWYENNISDGSKMQESPTAGFIAQELDEAQTAANAEWLNLVLKDNPEKLEATPGNLLPVMVKAIQELNKKSVELGALSTELQIDNKELRTKNQELAERLSTLEAMVKSLVEQRQDGEKKSIGELR